MDDFLCYAQSDEWYDEAWVGWDDDYDDYSNRATAVRLVNYWKI